MFLYKLFSTCYDFLIMFNSSIWKTSSALNIFPMFDVLFFTMLHDQIICSFIIIITSFSEPLISNNYLI